MGEGLMGVGGMGGGIGTSGVWGGGHGTTVVCFVGGKMENEMFLNDILVMQVPSVRIGASCSCVFPFAFLLSTFSGTHGAPP